ncbi:MAG TPA: hypothetical protein VNR39_13330 [Pseudolabrys sp.]|nr:hypothetical protein [Pseudolabrys sp.]
MLLLSEADIERLIDPVSAIKVVADCFRAQAVTAHAEHGRLDAPRCDPKGSVLVLAGHGDGGLFAAKTNVHVYPDAQSGRRLARSAMLLWDSARCEPLAMLATTDFNNHRTGAGLAAATDALAAKGARVLVMIGAGKIAPAAIRYLAAVRTLTKIFIFGRRPQRARELAESVGQWPSLAGCAVIAGTDMDAALNEADIVVTLTTSATPVMAGASVKPGALVILAGANRADAREADDALMRRAQVYADDVVGCRSRAGDVRIPLESGAMKPEQFAGAIGLAIAGQPVSPPAGVDITVFKSMGIIEQDLVVADWLVKRALEQSIGLDYDPLTGAYGATAPQAGVA